jgi:hypothetical protein
MDRPAADYRAYGPPGALSPCFWGPWPRAISHCRRPALDQRGVRKTSPVARSSKFSARSRKTQTAPVWLCPCSHFGVRSANHGCKSLTRLYVFLVSMPGIDCGDVRERLAVRANTQNQAIEMALAKAARVFHRRTDVRRNGKLSIRSLIEMDGLSVII